MTQQNCGEKLILLHRINCLTDIGETGNDKMSTSLTRSANPSGGKMTTPELNARVSFDQKFTIRTRNRGEEGKIPCSP